MQTITISTPSEKLVVAQNGTPKQKQAKPSSELEQLFKANTSFAVWLIFLAIGGGMLVLYYAHIGYLPEIEWQAALTYLFIGTMVGGVIGLLLTLSLYLPGLIWSESIVFDRCLNFFYPPPKKQADKQTIQELCIRTIFGYLGFPFLLVLLLSHIALLTGNFVYWLLALVLLGATLRVMRILFRYRLLPDNEPTRKQRPWDYLWSNLIKMTKPEDSSVDITTIDRHAFKLASSFTLSVLLNQISMYLVYRLSGSPTDCPTFVALTLICTGGVWVAAHVVALRHQEHPRQAIVASLVAAGLLLFTADNFSKLSVQLLNNFGIGYYEKVNVLVNEHGSQILGGLGVAKCGTDRLYNVEILSKLGEDYYLKTADKTYITLPKKDVVAISRLEQNLEFTQPAKN